MKRAIYILILLLGSVQLQASSIGMNKEYEQAYLELLRLKFSSAESIIAKQKTADNRNVMYHYLEGYMNFLSSVISEEEPDYRELLDRKSARMRAIEQTPQGTPWRMYAMAQLNLQSGVAAMKFGEYTRAARDLTKAYNQFRENNKLFPGFKPNLTGMGLFNILIGSIPENYKWVSDLFGFEGDVNKGVHQLQEALQVNMTESPYPYLYYESLFLSTFVTFNLANTNENAGRMLTILKRESADKSLNENPLLLYAAASFYADRGENDNALLLLINKPKSNEHYPFHYLDYLTGNAMLKKLDPRARIYLLKFTSNFKGRNFIKSAYQKIAWSYLIEGDTANYNKYISRIKLCGFTDVDNDKEAQKEALSGQVPHAELLKARLLFDGGYYTQAQKTLQTIHVKKLPIDRQIEHSYRMARIQHKLGNIAKAKEAYMQTYRLGKSRPVYYAANSMLSLGSIYEEEGEANQALWCYKECQKLDFDEYRNSILQKAKAGINRVNH